MTIEPRRSVIPSLRIRTKLSNVSLIYSIPLRKVALALTGKPNLAALFSWCQDRGVGVDGFHLGLIPGGSQGAAWVDARRENGVFIDRIGNVVATLVDGKLEGDTAWSSWLSLLPATDPVAWGSAPKPAAPKPAAPKRAAPKATSGAPALTARVDVELTSRAQLEKLSPVHRRQLEAASKDLCGKKGLPALFRWCDAEAQGLAHVTVTEGKTPRFEAWLTAPLEDGVFFDAKGTAPSGLAISQADVYAQKTARKPDGPALALAMKKLKAPRAPRWKG